MPVKSRKSFTRRPRTGGRRKPLVVKLARQVKFLRKSMPERKAVSTGLINATFSLAGSFALLNSVRVGDNSWQREGKNITFSRMSILGHITLTGDATATGSDFCRMLIVHDKQTNGAIFSYASLLANIANGGASTSTVYTQRNVNNMRRFTILFQKQFSRPPIGAAGTVATVSNNYSQLHGDTGYNPMVRSSKKISVKTVYEADAGTVADITRGSIYLLCIGLYAAPQYQFEGQIRFNYVD
nr:MAG TPA: capsid protein [Cressdnaviricota sp.]